MRFSTIRQKLEDWLNHPGFVPLFLLLLSILAYGLMIPWLHLYLDDWIWAWTWGKMGPAGLIKYFSTNRPVWGLLYQVILPLVYPHVIAFHLYSLVVRWCSALAFYWLLCLLWPDRKQTAFYGAAIFLLYPGFAMQPVGLTYGSLFLVYIFFLLSLCLNLLALKRPNRFWLYTTPALLLSVANLFMVEFFFTVELTRLLILWITAGRGESTFMRRVRKTLAAWLPYLIVFITAVVWRAFIFKFQNFRYQFSFTDQVKSDPFHAITGLFGTILKNLWEVSLGAWMPAINRLAHLNLKSMVTLLTLLVLIVVTGLIWWGLRNHRNGSQHWEKSWAVEASALGLLSMLTAGWPFWLTGLSIEPLSYSSRFTLPFILGAAIFLLGLLELLPPGWLRAGLVALALGIASANHFQVANDFRLSWLTNQKIFWQIAWRVPALEKGTAVLIPEEAVRYYNLTVFSSELTTMYPVEGNDLPYYVFYLDQLSPETNNRLPDNFPLSNDNITSEFHGSTSQLLATAISPGRCVRFLDRNVDGVDQSVRPRIMRAAALSDINLIQVTPGKGQPDMYWFGQEPAHDWCYYYEKADMARQQGDWQKIIQLGDQAAGRGLSPLGWEEQFPFIEAKAHDGRWSEALADSVSLYDDVSKGPVICRLWTRMIETTGPSPEKDQAVQSLAERKICPEFAATKQGHLPPRSEPAHIVQRVGRADDASAR